jgi:hypothetical protein
MAQVSQVLDSDSKGCGFDFHSVYLWTFGYSLEKKKKLQAYIPKALK